MYQSVLPVGVQTSVDVAAPDQRGEPLGIYSGYGSDDYTPQPLGAAEGAADLVARQAELGMINEDVVMEDSAAAEDRRAHQTATPYCPPPTCRICL